MEQYTDSENEEKLIKKRKARTWCYVLSLILIFQLLLTSTFDLSLTASNFFKYLLVTGCILIIAVTFITLILAVTKRAKFTEFICYLFGIIFVIIIAIVLVNDRYHKANRKRLEQMDTIHLDKNK